MVERELRTGVILVAEEDVGGSSNGTGDILESWSGRNSDTPSDQDHIGTTLLMTSKILMLCTD